MTRTAWSPPVRLLALLAISMMLLGFGAAGAHAAPSEPTLTVEQLDSILSTNPAGVSGHFLTVTQGSTIKALDATVIGTTMTDGTAAGGPTALILFESTDPLIARLGGIANGMSGSPLYVDVEGVDYLVGAVSFGDAFTRNGMGLATPIGSMSAIQSGVGATRLTGLVRPAVTAAGAKTTIVITDDASRFGDPGSGVIVVEPLASAFVGGIRPGSAAFTALESAGASRGLSIVRTGAPAGLQSTFSAPFVPGAAMSALMSRGDLWYGSIGTVTYIDGDTVVGFGHPLMHEGDTSLYLANAWIDGIWANTMFPYKLGRPGMVRGTVLQDRGAGVLGVAGGLPAETTVTARATRADNGQSATTTSWIPRRVADAAEAEYGPVTAAATSIAGNRLFDQTPVKGSALTTTTIVVTDGTETYRVVRHSVVDAGVDIVSAVNEDVLEMSAALSAVNGTGFARSSILSVDLESVISRERRAGRIVDVQAPAGIVWGDNLVRVSYLRHGVAATQTVDITLTVPFGTPLEGDLTVTGGTGDPQDEFEFEAEADGSWNRDTVADVVRALREAVPSNRIGIAFRPGAVTDNGETNLLPQLRGMQAASEITTGVDADLVMSGSKSKAVTTLRVTPQAPVRYRSRARISGSVEGAESGEIAIYRRYAGETTESRVATALVDPTGFFSAYSPVMTKNARFRVVYLGTDSTLASTAAVSIKTRAAVSVRTSAKSVARGRHVTLEAVLAPAGTTGRVVFERHDGRRWVKLSTRTLKAGTASYRYKASVRGVNKVRVRYLGGPINASRTSYTKKFTVR